MGDFNLSDLIGTEIVEHETVTKELVGRAIKKTKWTVIEAYPQFVKCMRVADNGAEIFTTFNIGTLVTMGVLKQKGRCKYYG